MKALQNNEKNNTYITYYRPRHRVSPATPSNSKQGILNCFIYCLLSYMSTSLTVWSSIVKTSDFMTIRAGSKIPEIEINLNNALH